jgi:hypothetical protein
MTIKGVEYASNDGAKDNTLRLALENVATHLRYKTWKEEWFMGTKPAEDWDSEEADSSDHGGDGDDGSDGSEVPPKKKAKRKAKSSDRGGDGGDGGDGSVVPSKKKAKRKAKSEAIADSDAEEGPTSKKGRGKRAAKKSSAVSHPTTAKKGPYISGCPTIGIKGPMTAPAFVPVDEDAPSNFGDGSETAGPDAQGLP